jgi:hypothetical protein
MWEWMYRSTFLDLDTSWRWVVSFTPLPLYLRRKSPEYTLNKWLGEPQSWSGRREEQKILDPTGTQTPTPLSFSPTPVTIPTVLKNMYKCRICGSHNSGYEVLYILEYNAVYSIENQPTCCSETSVDHQRSTRRYIPENRTLQSR